MINEKKLKLMIKMARYEESEGKDDKKISEYYRNDYASLHTLYSIFWMTIGYVLLLVLVGLAGMDFFTSYISMANIVVVLGGIAIGYLVILFIGGTASYFFYSKKHQDARTRIKILNHNIIKLLKMYEKEKQER